MSSGRRIPSVCSAPIYRRMSYVEILESSGKPSAATRIGDGFEKEMWGRLKTG